MPERIAPLEALAKRVPLAVFGNGWERVPKGSPLREVLHPPIFGRRLRTVNASAAVNIAFVAKSNRDEHTMRTFEIPACGGFMLAERTGAHVDLLREDEEAAFFGSVEELVEKAVRYLGDPDARRRIAKAGRLRITGRERYEDRAGVVVDIVRQVLASQTGAGERRSA
jgi:spore maturation protein CgeB